LKKRKESIEVFSFSSESAFFNISVDFLVILTVHISTVKHAYLYVFLRFMAKSNVNLN